MLHYSWDMVHEGCNYFSSLVHFLLFYSPNSPKNQNFEKMKKTIRDIIILHMCIKNYDQMMYSSWDMAHDRCNCYFSFWAIFCLLTPPKNQNFGKMKRIPGDIIILHKCTRNYDQIMYGSWDMLRNGQMDGQMDGWKKWHKEVGAPPKKPPGDIIILQKSYDHMLYCSWDMVRDRCKC